MPLQTFTDAQILDAMNAIVASGALPTLDVVMRKTGMQSSSTASLRLHELAGKGLLRRFKSKRGYTFLPADFCVNAAHREMAQP